MIKLLLGRLLPAGLTVGLLTSALSPLQPALHAFGIAANALGGDANAGGVDLPGPGALPQPRGFFSSLFSSRQGGDHARREIEGLVEGMKAKQDQAAKEAAEKMGKKPRKQKKGKPPPKPEAPKPPDLEPDPQPPPPTGPIDTTPPPT